MNASAFLETINGFDLLLVAIAIGIGYYASIQGDLADRWQATAQYTEVALKASYEQVDDLLYKVDFFTREIKCLRETNIEGNQAFYELSLQHNLMARFIDKKCYCLKSHTEIRCPFHDFVEQERERQIDPWSAPPQTPRKATQEDLDRWADLV